MSYILDAGNENSKVVHITSTDATHKFTEGYLKYDLETPILTPPNQDTLVSLYSAVIPYSFYNVREDINDRVYYRKVSDNSQGFFVIPKGSYTINSLQSFLQTQFNLAPNFTPNNTVITFDRTTMKYKFSQTAVEWFFDFNGGINQAHVSLGFPENHTSNASAFVLDSVSGLYSMESVFVPDVNGATHSVNIRTNLASKGCVDSQSKSFSTILGTIPIDVNFGGVIFFRPADAIHKIVITSKDIKNIVIRLTDDRDRLLDLNGLSFNVTILIDHIKHGRNIERRREVVSRPLPKPKRGRPPKKNPTERTKKDIPIPLIN